MKNNKNLVTTELIKFNEPNLNGVIYTKDSFDYKSLDNLKLRGILKHYEVDENGIKIITSVDVLSFDI